MLNNLFVKEWSTAISNSRRSLPHIQAANLCPRSSLSSVASIIYRFSIVCAEQHFRLVNDLLKIQAEAVSSETKNTSTSIFDSGRRRRAVTTKQVYSIKQKLFSVYGPKFSLTWDRYEEEEEKKGGERADVCRRFPHKQRSISLSALIPSSSLHPPSLSPSNKLLHPSRRLWVFGTLGHSLLLCLFWFRIFVIDLTSGEKSCSSLSLT